MATSTPAAWANLDSCHEIVAGPALRARLAQATERAGREPASPRLAVPGQPGTGPASNGPASAVSQGTALSNTGLSNTGPEDTGPESGRPESTVVVLRPAGAHARPDAGGETGEVRPGGLTRGRHRRQPQVAASA